MVAVSIIVPSYNHRPYLEKRIASIYAQQHRDFEVIVLDDASTDGSQEELSRLAERYGFSLIINEKNSGSPFIQWEKGIRLAHGKYVWIAESDDIAHPEFLKVMLDEMEAHQQAGIAFSHSWIVNSDGIITGTTAQYLGTNFGSGWHKNRIISGADAIQNYLVRGNFIPNASSALIRKSFIEKALPLDSNYVLAGDWLTYAKVLLNSDLIFVNLHLNYYRKHATSVRSLTHENNCAKEHCRVRLEIMNLARRNKLAWRNNYRSLFNNEWTKIVHNPIQVGYPFIHSIDWELRLLLARLLCLHPRHLVF
jgi:glycosyltransferase involved in cell wall biosynthesis